jgi:hypothetical protein
MRILELLEDVERRRFAAQPEADALRDVDALQEAQLLDLHVDVLRSSAYLLFDCRGALQIEMGNTAIVAVGGLQLSSWSALLRGPRTAWSVVGWEPHMGNGRWAVSAAFSPRARLELTATSAEFYVGNVPGCDAAPPDFMEADEKTLRAGLASWQSDFDPVHATFLDTSTS